MNYLNDKSNSIKNNSNSQKEKVKYLKEISEDYKKEESKYLEIWRNISYKLSLF